jgi:Protein of unknown function (DUF2793)
MKKLNLLSLLLILALGLNAQQGVKIGNNVSTLNPDAILELETTNKGYLLPRVQLSSTVASSPLAAHVAGMTVFNIAAAGAKPTEVFANAWYYNDGTQWIKLEGQECENFVAVVKNMSTSTPPASPNHRDAYLIKPTGLGAWAGKNNQVATWDTSVVATGKWNYHVPATCDQILDESTGMTHSYNTSNTWVQVPGDNTSYWKLGGNVNADANSNII